MKIQALVNEKNLYFFTMGIGEINISNLKYLAPDSVPPADLESLKFFSFFDCLSEEKETTDILIDFDDPSSWMDSFTID